MTAEDQSTKDHNRPWDWNKQKDVEGLFSLMWIRWSAGSVGNGRSPPLALCRLCVALAGSETEEAELLPYSESLPFTLDSIIGKQRKWDSAARATNHRPELRKQLKTNIYNAFSTLCVVALGGGGGGLTFNLKRTDSGTPGRNRCNSAPLTGLLINKLKCGSCSTHREVSL